MFVSVQFYGVQRQTSQRDEVEVPLLKDYCVKDIVAYLRKQYPHLNLGENDVLVAVNDIVTTMNHPLKANDQITFLPHIGGG